MLRSGGALIVYCALVPYLGYTASTLVGSTALFRTMGRYPLTTCLFLGVVTTGEMVKDPEFLAKADRISMNIDYLSAGELRAFVETEAAFYTDLAGRIGIRK